jgi:hypothetical protein
MKPFLNTGPLAPATLFANIERQLVEKDYLGAALSVLTRTAVDVLPGSECAGMTVGRVGKDFDTVAVTDELAFSASTPSSTGWAAAQCVDAGLNDRVFRAVDLRTATRWPLFGQLAAQVGVQGYGAGEDLTAGPEHPPPSPLTTADVNED